MTRPSQVDFSVRACTLSQERRRRPRGIRLIVALPAGQLRHQASPMPLQQCSPTRPRAPPLTPWQEARYSAKACRLCNSVPWRRIRLWQTILHPAIIKPTTEGRLHSNIEPSSSTAVHTGPFLAEATRADHWSRERIGALSCCHFKSLFLVCYSHLHSFITSQDSLQGTKRIQMPNAKY
jgi:hypothetical protein